MLVGCVVGRDGAPEMVEFGDDAIAEFVVGGTKGLAICMGGDGCAGQQTAMHGARAIFSMCTPRTASCKFLSSATMSSALFSSSKSAKVSSCSTNNCSTW